MPNWIIRLILIVFLTTGVHSGFATHIRSGNISAEVIDLNPTQIRFTVVLYRDGGSIVPIGGGQLDFWDGNVVQLAANADSSVVRDFGNRVEEHVFYITHEYVGNPQIITVNYFEANRNAGTLNIANSVNTTFSISTTMQVRPDGVLNDSPIFLIPAIDNGVVGQRFEHNVGAFDPNGDSISYELVIPEQQHANEVRGYYYPDTTYINDLGTLIWETPEFPGQYAFAILVTEWRKNEWEYVKIGTIRRDLQVFIGTEPNEAPRVDPGGTICITAGDTLSLPITAIDPNGDKLRMVIFGDALAKEGRISLDPDSTTFHPSPLDATLTWITNCTDVRQSAYSLFIRVSDDYQNAPLASYSVWNIRIVGPPPDVDTLSSIGSRSSLLSWDPYCNDTVDMEVWRRVGSFPYSPGECSIDLPSSTGYKQVAAVSSGLTSFTDGNLARGAKYCYRLMARWPDGTPGIVSEEICITIPVEAPVITKASVVSTSAVEGANEIEWTSSFEREIPNASNFSYTLQELVDESVRTIANEITDTTFIHSSINTTDDQHRYRVLLVDDSQVIDSSEWAETPILEGRPDFEGIELSWSANVPWSNMSFLYPYHYIYRNRTDPDDENVLLLIDSVKVSEDGFNYFDLIDEGFGNYQYHISTTGTYDNPLLPEPLINNSQIINLFVRDTIAPCPPVLVIENGSEEACIEMINAFGCESTSLFNLLDINTSCEENDLSHYNVYFTPIEAADTMTYLGKSVSGAFKHEDLSSIAGCYRVTAVDLSGNESTPSEIACRDNCFALNLPNIITPNNDGANDTFKPGPLENGKVICGSFIKEITVAIFNRYGRTVHESSISNIDTGLELWNGRLANGSPVSAGTYYYQVNAITIDLSGESTTEFSGWLQVIY